MTLHSSFLTREAFLWVIPTRPSELSIGIALRKALPSPWWLGAPLEPCTWPSVPLWQLQFSTCSCDCLILPVPLKTISTFVHYYVLSAGTVSGTYSLSIKICWIKKQTPMNECGQQDSLTELSRNPSLNSHLRIVRWQNVWLSWTIKTVMNRLFFGINII